MKLFTQNNTRSSYQTSSGIEQPGFLLGTQFLLPWDVPAEDSHINKLSEPKNAWKHRTNRYVLLDIT